MESLIIHFKSTKEKNTIKKILKALDADFEITNSNKNEKPYKPEFTTKIKKSEREYKKGQYRTLDIETLWK